MNNNNLTPPPPRQWTVMVYLAGDNDLETYGDKDLREMKKVGSSAEVAVVAQFDRMSDQVSRRYYLTAGADLAADVVAELPEVNTGDPQALVDFVTWAGQTYPAARYGLVLWNHGSGWKEDDVYHLAQRQGTWHRVTRGQVRGLTAGKASRAFFTSTLEQLVVHAAETERAILFDDSAADFLDNRELHSVLRQATAVLGQPLDLLGFDACLMNMLEVAYQVRTECQLIVGSQEVEPGDGWPYDAILARLRAQPEMAAATLGQSIVAAYIEFYQTYHPRLAVTQSAIRAAGIEAVAAAVHELARALMKSLPAPETLGVLFGALRSAQTFTDRDYIDLAHFCELLTRNNPPQELSTAVQQVLTVLRAEASPVVAAAHHGHEVANARGLSIYLPVRVLSPLYAQLEFARQYEWDEFLRALVQPS